MRILGIDYGRKKVGLAWSEGKLAEPLAVVGGENPEDLISKIKKVAQEKSAQAIVFGISENKMAVETKVFAKKLKEVVILPLYYQDETLTSREAQRLAINAGVGREKRKAMEDAYAAALMLQSYLETRDKNV